MGIAPKTVAKAMDYLAMSISGAILVASAFATIHFWSLAGASFGKSGGLPSWSPISVLQGAFAGVLDYTALLTVLSELYWAWAYGILAACFGVMTVLGSRRAWLRLRDIIAGVR